MEYNVTLRKSPLCRRFGLNIVTSIEHFRTVTYVDGQAAPCVLTKRMHIALNRRGTVLPGDRIMAYNGKPDWSEADLRARRIRLTVRRGDAFAALVWKEEGFAVKSRRSACK